MKKQPVRTDFILLLPKVDEIYQRIIRVEGSSGSRDRVVCHTAYPDICSGLLGKELNATHWTQVVVDALNSIISEAYMDHHFGGDLPAENSVSLRFQAWLNTSPNIMDVDTRDVMKTKSIIQTIRLDVLEEQMSHNSRVFDRSWLQYIDPTSTPTSEKVNLVYKLSHGASVKDGKIYPGTSIFCTTVHDNAIASIYNPRRSYLMRTTFENTVKLVKPETPSIQPRNNSLHGIHLNTAVMHYGVHTYEDAICISQQAADKFGCFVDKRVSFKSVEDIEVLVKKGEIVKPGQLLAKTTDAQEMTAEKILYNSNVTNIETDKVIHHGRRVNSCRITMTSQYSLKEGDKLSNRGTGKGVVVIMPNNLMPKDENGEIIDVIIGPESIAGRRALTTYWEMMAHKAISDGVKVSGDLGNPEPDFKALTDMGYGDKQQLFKACGKPFDEKTFCGKIFWLRINKHSCEQASGVGSKRVLNSHGVLIDDAKISGQRIDLAKAIAMKDRGFDRLLSHVVKGNSFGNKRLESLASTLV